MCYYRSKVMVPLGQADLADRGVRWAAIQVWGDLIMVVFWGCFGGGVKVKEMCCHVLNMYFCHILSAGLQI